MSLQVLYKSLRHDPMDTGLSLGQLGTSRAKSTFLVPGTNPCPSGRVSGTYRDLQRHVLPFADVGLKITLGDRFQNSQNIIPPANPPGD